MGLSLAASCGSHQPTSGVRLVNGILPPPLDVRDATFDVVISNSVFSHLTLDAARAWTDEMARIMKPGGLALLSYHGDFSLATFLSNSEALVRKVMATGFNSDSRANEVNDVISDPEYYRNTFMTDRFARDLFGDKFSICDQLVGTVSRFQNVAVLRRTGG